MSGEVKDEPSRRWIFGWTKWTWATIAFVGLALTNAFSIWRVQELGKKEVAQVAQSFIDSQYVTCLSNNLVRSEFQKVIIKATEKSPFQFSALPGFSNLDPETQSYFRNLDALLAKQPDDPQGLRATGLAATAPRPCEVLYGGHTPGLKLPPTPGQEQPVVTIARP